MSIRRIFIDCFPKPILYDSSSSDEARVIYIEKDRGYFLKSAEKGSLKIEAQLTKYFHNKGLSADVLEYLSSDKDWLLTEKVKGEDCTDQKYLDDPKRLCDVIAESLLRLHSLDFAGCPVQNRTETYLTTVERNYTSGNYDKTLFPDNWGYASAQEAWKVINAHKNAFQIDTLIHGDYCLPNIILDDWKFSGFIDVCAGGVGDKHIDIFWGIWTLGFNLKTDNFASRFIDAYGRNAIDLDMIRAVAAAEVFG